MERIADGVPQLRIGTRPAKAHVRDLDADDAAFAVDPVDAADDLRVGAAALGVDDLTA